MKKEYMTPDVTINRILLEMNFLASGENLTELDFGPDDSFWDIF